MDISENPGMQGLEVALSYDDNLTLTKAVVGDVFENATATESFEWLASNKLQKQTSADGSVEFVGSQSSPCTFFCDAIDLSTDYIKDGNVLTLTFAVSEEATAWDEYLISVSFVDSYDNQFTVQAEYEVLIIDYLPGDVNNNGVVNAQDVAWIRQYIVDGRKYDPDGYAIQLNEQAADVSGDGIINAKDVAWIRQYIVDGRKYDPDGYAVSFVAKKPACTHTMEAIPYKAATCTENGNVSYWYCTTCRDCFNDEKATLEIDVKSTVLAATNHEGTVVTHEAKAATETEVGWNVWSECTVCGYQPIPYVEIPVIVPDKYTIIYNIKSGTDAYLDGLVDAGEIINPNASYCAVGTSYTLKNLTAPDGYVFEGWYDGFGTTAQKIMSIPADTTGEFEVYAKWSVIEYNITYSVYGTPIQPVSDDSYLSYTANKGLYNLPNPDLYNYIFLGWYRDDGTEVKEIPVGTTGDIKLNGYFTSERNLAKAVEKLENPFIVEDVDNNVIYFTYELGTIENVPISDAIWTIQNVAGLTQQISHEVTISIGTEEAQSIAQSIANATVNSSTWTLSKDWNEITEINEAWANEHGITKEEAETIAKSNSDSYCISQASGGNSTTTNTNGTTTLTYDSVNKDSGEDKVSDFGWHADLKVSGSYSNEGNLTSSVLGTYEVGAELSGGIEGGSSTTTYGKTSSHTGTDTTKVNTTVSESSSSWNNSETKTQTETASKSNMISQAISDIITSSKGYGNSYSNGGENSESQEFNFSQSESNDYSTMLTYSSAEVTTTTTTYTADGKIEGKYRLVLAGTVHVFGVVGYDIATNSYFTYTFNVMDDEVHEFLDYTPKGSNFDDCEYSVLPFEIPYFVHEYVTSEIATTEGLVFKTNSSTKTATVTNYTGTSADVVVPSFISSGGIAYKVTGISATAFAGKSVRAIMLGRYIQEIPAGAFKNCGNLESISGYFTVIGAEAFSGCTSMDNFVVSDAVTAIGENAFADVSQLTVKALSENNAMQAAWEQNPGFTKEQLVPIAKEMTKKLIEASVALGADRVILDISGAMQCDSLHIEVPQIAYFELQGGKGRYSEVQIISDAATTVLTKLTIHNEKNIPLQISSDKLILDTVTINSASFGMMFEAGKTTVSLIRDNHLTSGHGIAVVTQDCVFESQITDNVAGYLEIDGDIYVYDEVRGAENIDCGKIVVLSAEEYSNYIKGMYTVTFDGNGGTTTQTDISVVYGNAMGALPTAVREQYVFNGWYTEPIGGTLVTAETVYSYAHDITLYAHWTVNTYTATWNNGTGYTITVTRTASPNAGAATGSLNSGAAVYYGDVLSVTYTASTGYSIAAKGATSITVTKNVTASDIFASASVNQYKVSWNTGTGYSITVKRTSSPNAGAAIGTLNSGDVVYHGDVLTVSYAANTGYSISSNGSTSVTVSGNVTSSAIYATASANSYTYNIVYQSSNGTALGTSTVTYNYGTTNTISPKDFSGYDTPSAQNISWDSTTAKTIIFTYTPSAVSFTEKSGYIDSQTYYKLGYSAKIEYQNRTATSVQLRVTWTATLSGTSTYNNYAQMFRAWNGSASTGNVKVINQGAWGYTTSSTRSGTASSGWITIPLSTTNATSVDLSIYYYQANSNGTDMSNYAGAYTSNLSTTWAIAIPAF